MRKITLWLCCAALTMLALSCRTWEQTAPPVATLYRPSDLNAPTNQWARGRTIFLTTCTRCHAAEPIRNYAAEDWRQKILPDMSELARLVPEDRAALRAYVEAVLRAPSAP